MNSKYYCDLVTCNILIILTHLMTSELIYLLMDCETSNQLLALEQSEMYSGFLQTSAAELCTKIISKVNIMFFNYSRKKFNLWRLTGPEWLCRCIQHSF